MLNFSKSLFVLFLVLQNQTGHSQALPYDPARLYPMEALRADLHFVRMNLEKMDAGLYRYTSKSSLNRFFDSLAHVIEGPMTGQDFFSLLTLLDSKIMNGHTMFLPGDSSTAYFSHRGRFLPLSVYYANRKLSVVENYSIDSTIKPGMEILSINGISISTIMEQLLVRQVRDGYNQTYPIWILNNYFSAYYSFTFGHPDKFSLELKDSLGQRHTRQLGALTKDSIRYYRQIRSAARYPADRDSGGRYPLASKGKGIFLEEGRKPNTAILTIKSFDPAVLQSVYHQDYKKAFDSVFTRISVDSINHLILDLRNNQGGEFSPACELLGYLALYPSRFLLDGKEARIIKPKAKGFKGKLVVLINGGSFSATVMLCASLKMNHRAVFVGEESGGNPFTISGDPVEMILPTTKIKAEISSTVYHITAGANDGHGIIPDHPIQPTIDQMLNGDDPYIACAFKILSQTN